jgi:hypothetical protein
MRVWDGLGGVGRGAVRVLRAAPPRGLARRRGTMRGARREMMRGLVWLVQTVRAPPPARARRCGPRAARRWEQQGLLAWMGKGVAHAASGMVQAVWAAGLCGSCGQRCLGSGTAPACDARREEGDGARSEEGDDARFGLACAVRTSASSRSCATMRPSGGEAFGATGAVSVDGEGRCACGLWDGSGGVGRGAVRVLRAALPRIWHGAGVRCAARGGR